MSQLSKLWAGRIYGTNTGNFFLKFDDVSDTTLRGQMRFLDSEYGVALYDVAGSFTESLDIKGTPAVLREDIVLGNIDITAKLTPEGYLRGEWTSSIGTGGTFLGYPHASEDEAQKIETKSQPPEQIFTHTIELGAVSLFGPDITALIMDIRKDFSVGRPIATYSTGAGEITRYADDFLAEASTLGTLSYLNLQIQEPEAHGINKITVIELRRYGISEVRAQGVSESWVVGRAEAIASRLKRHQNSFVTAYKKFGLNINQAIFLVMLILIPQFTSIGKRAAFVISVYVILHALLWVHSRLIPSADIRASSPAPSQIARALPSIASFLFAIIASLVAAYIYTWLVAP
jgi:hypothetical protein